MCTGLVGCLESRMLNGEVLHERDGNDGTMFYRVARGLGLGLAYR